VLDIADLRVTAPGRAGDVPLLRGVDLQVRAGERVGLIGESGSGKTLTALAALGLLDPPLTVTGSVRLDGVDLVGRSERDLARMRGRTAAMVFQEPMTALDPLVRVGRLIGEAVALHRPELSRADVRAVVLGLMEQVGLPDPPGLARARPFELSGGQRQRVGIAMAIALDPALLVCDEPTTALDVTVARQVVDLVDDLVGTRGTALLYVTHDLGVVRLLCDRVVVLYGGVVVEEGPTAELLAAPRHPYTAGLLAAADLSGTGSDGRLVTVPGSVPPPAKVPSGCPFRDRCDRVRDDCAGHLVSTTVRADPGGRPTWAHACRHPLEPATSGGAR
jgi:peptide/nickel transport system ATP-binding protein